MKPIVPPIKIGDRFGKLQVITVVPGNAHKGRTYICLCDCSQLKTTDRSYLIADTKQERSCGCSTVLGKSERINIGDRIGILTVLKIDSIDSDYPRFTCKCDCGVVKEFNSYHLFKDDCPKRSCGCDRPLKKGQKRINIGDKFNKLTVIGQAPNSEDNKRQFICHCECGNITVVLAKLLTSEKRPTRSCGCLQWADISIGDVFYQFTVLGLDPIRSNDGHRQFICQCTCGEIKSVQSNALLLGKSQSCGCLVRNDEKEIWEGQFHYHQKYMAEPRGLELSLTLEQFKALSQSNCHYCNEAPFLATRSGIRDGQPTQFRNGIDRKDSSLGYVIENCVPCCFPCNLMKGTTPYEEFLARISKINNHRILPIELEINKEDSHHQWEPQKKLG
jgi:hypothetical protein